MQRWKIAVCLIAFIMISTTAREDGTDDAWWYGWARAGNRGESPSEDGHHGTCPSCPVCERATAADSNISLPLMFTLQALPWNDAQLDEQLYYVTRRPIW